MLVLLVLVLRSAHLDTISSPPPSAPVAYTLGTVPIISSIRDAMSALRPRMDCCWSTAGVFARRASAESAEKGLLTAVGEAADAATGATDAVARVLEGGDAAVAEDAVDDISATGSGCGVVIGAAGVRRATVDEARAAALRIKLLKALPAPATPATTREPTPAIAARISRPELPVLLLLLLL